ncbi:MAG: DMT family transporter [Planktotalea sp.]|uniref:DMT family transporter n=1 Tax=Planktotalea sp. TaxID=2029877 RepID=UPI003C76A071
MGNSRAVLLMVLSMAAFAIGDAMVKMSSGNMSIAQILIFMSLPGLAIFTTLAHRAGQSPFSRDFFAWPVLLRNGIESLAALCMVSALALAPLALVISITQAVPLFVTIGAALILKEQVGPRRWIAVLAGFCGVLLMLRPSTAGISVGAALALGAAVFLAGRDIITRAMPMRIGTLQMATWGTAAMIPAGLIMLPFTGPHEAPGLSAWSIVIAASLANAAGYYSITAAMRMGDVSFVTPFRYSRLIFALVIAVLFFQERPDALTLLGAAIVIGSGLFVMWRERKARVSDNI